MRSTSALPIKFIRSDSLAASTVPAATASPCNHVPYPIAFSIAWPKVWPKFRIALTPCSRSSSATTSTLFLQLRSIASSNILCSLAKSLVIFFSSHSKNARSRINPYLIISAIPLINSLLGKVSRVVLSANTIRG